mgnify:CR=1 FL=1
MWYVVTAVVSGTVGLLLGGVCCAAGRADQARRPGGYEGPEPSDGPTEDQVPMVKPPKPWPDADAHEV